MFQTFENPKASARAVAASKGKLIAGFLDKKLQIYNLVDNKYEFAQDVEFLDDYVYSIKIKEDGSFIVGCKDKKIYYLDEFGTPIGILEGHEGPVNCI